MIKLVEIYETTNPHSNNTKKGFSLRETLSVSYDKNELVSFDQKLIVGNYFKYDFNDKSNLFGWGLIYQEYLFSVLLISLLKK